MPARAFRASPHPAPRAKPNNLRVKLATWNVNSLRVRLPHLLDWLAAHSPDAMCLQETKCEDGLFPYEELRSAGYCSLHNGQRTYNGVAVLTRAEGVEVCRAIPGFTDDQSRVMAADYEGVRVVSVYVPNGQAVGSDKYEYKLRWMERFRVWLATHERPDQPLAVVGDFNVAPTDRDVWDPKVWRGKTLFTDEEKAALAAIAQWGLHDAFRKHHPDEGGLFSYFDYRGPTLYMNQGLRIDHVYVTEPLLARCVSCDIDKDARKGKDASDHAPVIAVFAA
jgi:exodeoxyribonuclease-3